MHLAGGKVNLHCDVEFNNMIDPVEKLKLLKKSKSKMPLMIPRRRPHRHTGPRAKAKLMSGQEAQETEILLLPTPTKESIIHLTHAFFNMVWLPYHLALAAFFIVLFHQAAFYFPRGLWTSCLVIETRTKGTYTTVTSE